MAGKGLESLPDDPLAKLPDDPGARRGGSALAALPDDPLGRLADDPAPVVRRDRDSELSLSDLITGKQPVSTALKTSPIAGPGPDWNNIEGNVTSETPGAWQAPTPTEAARVVGGIIPKAGQSIINAVRGGAGLAGQALEGLTSESGPGAQGNPLSQYGRALREEAASGAVAKLMQDKATEELITPKTALGRIIQTIPAAAIEFAPATGLGALEKFGKLKAVSSALGGTKALALVSGLHSANTANEDMKTTQEDFDTGEVTPVNDPNRGAKMLGATLLGAGTGAIAGKLVPDTMPLSRAFKGAPWQNGSTSEVRTEIGKWLWEASAKALGGASVLTTGQVAEKGITGGKPVDVGDSFLQNLASIAGFTIAHGAAQVRAGSKSFQSNEDGTFSFKAEAKDPKTGDPVHVWVTAKVDPDGIVKVAVPVGDGTSVWVKTANLAPADAGATPSAQPNPAGALPAAPEAPRGQAPFPAAPAQNAAGPEGPAAKGGRGPVALPDQAPGLAQGPGASPLPAPGPVLVAPQAAPAGPPAGNAGPDLPAGPAAAPAPEQNPEVAALAQQVQELQTLSAQMEARAQEHPHVEEAQADADEAADLLQAAKDRLQNVAPGHPMLQAPEPVQAPQRPSAAQVQGLQPSGHATTPADLPPQPETTDTKAGAPDGTLDSGSGSGAPSRPPAGRPAGAVAPEPPGQRPGSGRAESSAVGAGAKLIDALADSGHPLHERLSQIQPKSTEPVIATGTDKAGAEHSYQVEADGHSIHLMGEAGLPGEDGKPRRVNAWAQVMPDGGIVIRSINNGGFAGLGPDMTRAVLDFAKENYQGVTDSSRVIGDVSESGRRARAKVPNAQIQEVGGRTIAVNRVRDFYPEQAKEAPAPQVVKSGETFTHNGREYRMATSNGKVTTRDLTHKGPPLLRTWGTIAEFEKATGLKVDTGEAKATAEPNALKGTRTGTLDGSTVNPYEEGWPNQKPSAGQPIHPRAQSILDKAMAEKDVETLGQILHPGNKGLRHQFEEKTGLTLPKGWNATRAAIAKHYEESTTPAEKPAGPGVEPGHPAYPYQQLGDAVVSRALAGEKLGNVDLRTMAGQFFSGQPSQKDLYDAVELGVNRHILAHPELFNVQQVPIKDVIRNLEDLVSKLPTQTHREANANEFQQYSTPPFYSAVVDWVANIRKGELVLEPSAGVGGLAVFPRLAGAEVMVNEFDRDRRAKLLESMPGWKSLGVEDARFINAHMKKAGTQPSVVVMNPPFSSTSGKVQGQRDSAQGVKHIQSALDSLAPGGRLVAIMGDMEGKGWRQWLANTRGTGMSTIQALVKVDGSTYRKYGTSFDSVVLVMDKVAPDPNHQILQASVANLEDLADILKGVRDERPDLQQPSGVSAEPGGRAASANGGRDGAQGPATPGRGGAGGDAALESAGKPGPAGVVPAGEAGGGGKPVSVRGGAAAVPGAPGVGPVAGPEGGAGALQPGKPGPVPPDESGRGSGEVSQPGGAPEHPGRAGSQDLPADHVAPTETKIEKSGGAPKGAVEESPDGVFSTYRPSKVSFPGARPHPGDLVESQAMAAVDLPDPKPTTKLHLPESIITSGKLSDAQMEAIFYATQATNVIMDNGERQGFLIGDGTGVGKGREIAGTIMSSINAGQGGGKAVWLSKNTDLFKDATRDWTGIGGHPDALFDFSKIKATEGGKGAKTLAPIPMDKGVLFGTYATVTGVKGEIPGARKEQLKAWLGTDFDGVIVLDEAHLASNLGMARSSRGKAKPSQTALGMKEIQEMFPKARVVYVTATVASDPTQLAFLERLGLWGKGKAFARPSELLAAVQNAGLAGMELVARDLKARGLYIARNLSYSGVNYRTLEHKLNPDQVHAYDIGATAWQKVLENVHAIIEEATGGKNGGKLRAAALSKFYGQQQAFFNSLLTSLTLPTAFQDMDKALQGGNSVVIQLTETGEARQGRAIEEASQRAKDTGEDMDVASIDLSPKDILIGFLKTGFPVNAVEEVSDEEGNKHWQVVKDSEGNPVQDPEAVRRRDDLIAEIATMNLPGSALDEILKHFGTDQVAEITGRSERRVFLPDGTARIERRTDKQVEGDKDAFMNGPKRILVFSKAANTGMSFHADNAAKNQTKRVHFVLQGGWNAADAIQGLGRTHRTNQAQAPEYVLVTTDLGGHKRFTSTIARRISQLGALTKGQRQASASLFTEKDNLESPTALRALSSWYNQIMSSGVLLPDGSTFTEAEFESATGLHLRDKDGNPLLERPPMKQFLNRVLALPVDQQNAVFDSLAHRIDEQYHVDEQAGLLEKGLQNIPVESAKVTEEDPFYKDPDTGASTVYQKIETQQKVHYQDFSKINQKSKEFVGFYQDPKRNIPMAITKGRAEMKPDGTVVQHYKLTSPSQVAYRPNVDLEKLEKLDPDAAEAAWEAFKQEQGDTATKNVHMVTGAMLNIWNRFPENLPMDVARIKLSNGNVAMGRVIPEGRLGEVLGRIGADKALDASQRALRDLDGSGVMRSVLQEGRIVSLANGMRLMPVKRSGEFFAVLEGVPHQTAMQGLVRQYEGWRMEQFQGQYGAQYKVVIPANAQAIGSLNAYLKASPVRSVSEPKPGWVRPRGAESGAVALDLLTAPYHAMAEGGKTIAQGIRQIVAPATVDELSQRAADIKAGKLGQLHLQDARARKVLEGAHKAMAKLTHDQALDLFDVLEGKGSIEDLEPGPMAEAARFMRKTLDQDYQDIVKTGKQLNYIESYFPHMYAKPEKARPFLEEYAKRPLEGSKDWAKHRSIPYLSEAVRERGLEPASWNPIELFLARHFDMQKFVMAHQLMAAYKKEKLVRYVRAAQTPPEAYVKLDDRISEVASIRRAVADVPTPEGAAVRTDVKLLPGAKMTYGSYYAPAAVARIFNNYLSPGFERTLLAKPYQFVRVANNLLNMGQLGLSGFHATFITIEGAAGSLSRGLLRVLRDGDAKGILDMAKGAALPLSVAETFKDGLAFRKAILSEDCPPEFRALRDMFIRGGGRVSMDKEYEAGFTKAFMDGWRKAMNDPALGTRIAGGAKSALVAPMALVEAAAAPIMKHYVPIMKLGTMAQLFADEMARLPQDATPAQIDRVARKVVDHVEDRMGQMTYDNLDWHAFTKQIMHLGFRAVGWDVGSWRMILGAGKDTLAMAPRAGRALLSAISSDPEFKKEIEAEQAKRDKAAGEYGHNTWATYNMAQTFAVAAVVALMSGLLTWIFTGNAPKDLQDLRHFRTGRMDKYGKPERLQFASYMKEMEDILHIALEAGHLNLSPAFKYLWGKKAPWLTAAVKFGTNQDWKGQQVYTPNAGKKTLAEFGLAALKEGMPISVTQSAEKWEVQGGAKSLLPAAGLTKPKQENINTKAENKLVGLLADRMPRVIEKAKGDREAQVRQAKDAFVLGNRKPLDELKAQGLLTAKDQKNIVSTFKNQSLIVRLSNATNIQADDLIKVWPDMTREEKEAVFPAIARKLATGFKSTPPAQRAELKEKWNQIVREVSSIKAEPRSSK